MGNFFFRTAVVAALPVLMAPRLCRRRCFVAELQPKNAQPPIAVLSAESAQSASPAAREPTGMGKVSHAHIAFPESDARYSRARMFVVDVVVLFPNEDLQSRYMLDLSRISPRAAQQYTICGDPHRGFTLKMSKGHPYGGSRKGAHHGRDWST